MEWMKTLINEYRRIVAVRNGEEVYNVPAAKIGYLMECFEREHWYVMETAVSAYIDDGNLYWPGKAQLMAHVKDAQFKWNSGQPLPENLTDDQRWRFELDNGYEPLELEALPVDYPVTIASGHIIDWVNGEMVIVSKPTTKKTVV